MQIQSDTLVVQWLTLWTPNVWCPGLVHSQGTRSHTPRLRARTQQLKEPASRNKDGRSCAPQRRFSGPNKQINIFFKKEGKQVQWEHRGHNYIYLGRESKNTAQRRWHLSRALKDMYCKWTKQKWIISAFTPQTLLSSYRLPERQE